MRTEGGKAVGVAVRWPGGQTASGLSHYRTPREGDPEWRTRCRGKRKRGGEGKNTSACLECRVGVGLGWVLGQCGPNAEATRHSSTRLSQPARPPVGEPACLSAEFLECACERWSRACSLTFRFCVSPFAVSMLRSASSPSSVRLRAGPPARQPDNPTPIHFSEPCVLAFRFSAFPVGEGHTHTHTPHPCALSVAIVRRVGGRRSCGQVSPRSFRRVRAPRNCGFPRPRLAPLLIGGGAPLTKK